jgi:hypothetical protein
VQTSVGDIQLLVNDTARNVETGAGVLPGVVDQVTTIHEQIPEMSQKVITIGDDLLPALFIMLRVHIIVQEFMMN